MMHKKNLNRKIFVTLIFISILLQSFLASIPIINSTMLNWTTKTIFYEGWPNNETLTDNWILRGSVKQLPNPEQGQWNITTLNLGAYNVSRLSAIAKYAYDPYISNWYGCEMMSKKQFDLTQEWVRITYKFNAPSFSNANRYAFCLSFWNGTFEDTDSYELEVPDWPVMFRIETLNETHSNWQTNTPWIQQENPLPYTGLTNVTCVIKRDAWNWYVNGTDYSAGFSGGTKSMYDTFHIYLTIQVYGNATWRYIDFYPITIETFVSSSQIKDWAFQYKYKGTWGWRNCWQISEEPVLPSTSDFPIYNDPSIIKADDAYYMAHSRANETYGEIVIRTSANPLSSWSSPKAIIPNGIKPWLSEKQNDGYYYIFYSVGGGHINRSRSTDLVNWVQLSTALSPTVGAWDDGFCGAPYLIHNGTVWFLFYYGANSSDPIDKTGFATSTSLNGNFIKYVNNPILVPSYLDSFVPEWGVLSSTIIKIGSYYYNFYNSYTMSPKNLTQERGFLVLNLARSQNLITWTKAGYPIIYPKNEEWEWKILIGSPAYLSLPSGDYLFVNAFNYYQHENIGWFLYAPIYEPLLPIMFMMGIVGLFAMFLGPVYCVHLVKKRDYYEALRTGLVITVIGLALFISWLWA